MIENGSDLDKLAFLMGRCGKQLAYEFLREAQESLLFETPEDAVNHFILFVSENFFCNRCGKRLPSADAACEHCGTSL
jgi:hypothetical protein